VLDAAPDRTSSWSLGQIRSISTIVKELFSSLRIAGSGHRSPSIGSVSQKAVRRNFTKFDSSGKSPAYGYHREYPKARTDNGGGLLHFLNSGHGAKANTSNLVARASS
jgi:hypothetical protein